MFHTQYTLIKPIASGMNAVVHLAKHKHRAEDVYVAAKVIHKTQPHDSCTRFRLHNERQNWSTLAAAPGICRLYDIFEEDANLIFVTEYCAGGTLQDIIQKAPHHHSTSTSTPLARGLMTALVSCHDKLIFHGDVKPSNIYLTEDGQVRLGDFGCSQVATGPTTGLWVTPCTRGTPEFLAPEVRARQEYGTQADMWSAGVCLKDLGVPPHDAITESLLHSDPLRRMTAFQAAAAL